MQVAETRRNEENVFTCEYDCGFTGGFEQVLAHESSCKFNPCKANHGQRTKREHDTSPHLQSLMKQIIKNKLRQSVARCMDVWVDVLYRQKRKRALLYRSLIHITKSLVRLMAVVFVRWCDVIEERKVKEVEEIKEDQRRELEYLQDQVHAAQSAHMGALLSMQLLGSRERQCYVHEEIERLKREFQARLSQPQSLLPEKMMGITGGDTPWPTRSPMTCCLSRNMLDVSFASAHANGHILFGEDDRTQCEYMNGTVGDYCRREEGGDAKDERWDHHRESRHELELGGNEGERSSRCPTPRSPTSAPQTRERGFPRGVKAPHVNVELEGGRAGQDINNAGAAQMSGGKSEQKSAGKGSGKQTQDTAAEHALLHLHHTHREAVRLFLMAVRQGDTDANIAHALRKGLPHLTAPDDLQDKTPGRQPAGTRMKKGMVAMTSEHIVHRQLVLRHLIYCS